MNKEGLNSPEFLIPHSSFLIEQSILVFDLDDTLYPELSYVHSGFRAVAAFLGPVLGVPV